MYNNALRQGDFLLSKKGYPQLVHVLRHILGIPFEKRLLCLSDIMLHLGPLDYFFIVIFLITISSVSKEYNVMILNESIVTEIMCKLSFKDLIPHWSWVQVIQKYF